MKTSNRIKRLQTISCLLWFGLTNMAFSGTQTSESKDQKQEQKSEQQETKKSASSLDVNRLKDILEDALRDHPESVRKLGHKFGMPKKMDQVLHIDQFQSKKPFAKCLSKDERRQKAIKHAVKLFKTMDGFASANTSKQDMLTFIENLEPWEIAMIFKVRKIYDRMAEQQGFEKGPSLDYSEVEGVMQGKSSIFFGDDHQRTFQKVFYWMEANEQSYFVGHNVSNTSSRISGQGFFRVYREAYPIYHSRGRIEWREFQPGSIGLSYEQKDVEPVNGMRPSHDMPQISHYNFDYNQQGKRLGTIGALFYGLLKDELISVVPGGKIIIAFAERPRNNIIPAGYFIATRKCGVVGEAKCPNNYISID